MKCLVCAGKLMAATTDLPFKVSGATIVIIKKLPVLQCERCNEYLLDNVTLARVEQILERADKAAELEIVPFAA
ncbi:MAG TPA: type II toxin-antitoxin system MqsA family antitoxin [Thermoanaerobaculia bacterium]|nr:type II toxin-antitoxin system MqsA family antitoxin [Thermoanaerobaculia bacterium]